MKGHGEDASDEGRGAFGGFIGPRTLVEQVRIAAPFLFDEAAQRAALPESRGDRLSDRAFHPLGWWSILRDAEMLEARAEPDARARTEYFALCLAAHFASAATYVPTDVDAKIRHALWFEGEAPEELARMRDLALQLARWDVRGVSARWLEVEGAGTVSGHDGERLSVLCGGTLALLEAGDAAGAAELEAEIDAELAREARAFAVVEAEEGGEVELLVLAAILTHNAGDVGQGLAAKGGRSVGAEQKQRFGDLARERFERYGGAFGRAAALFREILAAEGHRNYPLRKTKLLRQHPGLLLPIGPCLDDWGAVLARWPAWSARERAEVVTAIVEGCRKVPGQESYYRALAGFEAAHPGGLSARDLQAHFATAARRGLEDATLRRKIAVPRASFERSLAKRARAVLSAGGARAPV